MVMCLAGVVFWKGGGYEMIGAKRERYFGLDLSVRCSGVQ